MGFQLEKSGKIDNKRIEYIDILRGIAMILVLIGHNDTILTNYIYSFHIPLFFFISGLTYKGNSDSLKEVIKKRLRNIVIPYFELSLFLYFLWILLMNFQGIVLYKNDILRNFVGIFYCQGVDNMAWGLQLWFLPCLFITSIIFSFISKIKKKVFVLISIIVVSSVGFLFNDILRINFLWSFDVALVGVLFYGTGFLLKNKLNIYKPQIVDYICMLISLVLLIIFNQLNGRIDMYSSQYNNIFLFISNSFLGIYIIIVVSKLIKQKRIIRFVGSNTIIILAFHIRVLDFIKKVFLIFFSSALNVNSIFNGVILVPILQIIIIAPIIFLLKQLKKYIKYARVINIKEKLVVLINKN